MDNKSMWAVGTFRRLACIFIIRAFYDILATCIVCSLVALERDDVIWIGKNLEGDDPNLLKDNKMYSESRLKKLRYNAYGLS